MRIRRKRRRLGKASRWFLFLSAVLVVIAVLLDSQLRPLVQTMAASQMKQLANTAINEAVQQEITALGVNYDTLVTVQRDEQGKVLALNTNTVKMNELKSKISLAVQQEMLKSEEREISVPLGTLLGNDWTRGIGPSIPLHLSLSGGVFTDFESNFTAAGINQTKHQISVSVRMVLYVLIPGCSTSTEVETSVLIAETVIVGEVPGVYANLNTEDASDLVDLAQLG
ncbi:MAG TPA: sporulation protein YunB [Candidatus Gallacutalibacter stercoravium]|nr:sporulation protein YunB [Candidatus Gallacutalibacter stercoravium]